MIEKANNNGNYDDNNNDDDNNNNNNENNDNQEENLKRQFSQKCLKAEFYFRYSFAFFTLASLWALFLKFLLL